MRTGSQDRGRVVVGVDGSPTSLAALRVAVGQARCRHAELRVVHVRPTARPRSTPAPGGGPAPWPPPTDVAVYETMAADNAALDLIETCLHRALGDVPQDLEVDPIAAVGDPADALCGQAWRAADLLVIGTQGGHRWRHPGRRSVSRYCFAHAGCAVLTVPRTRLADSTDSERPHPRHDLWHDFYASIGERQRAAR